MKLKKLGKVKFADVLQVKDVEVRAGARLLLSPVSFQVAAGDRIGLVGRNGAGKTTLTRILAGEGLPAADTVTRVVAGPESLEDQPEIGRAHV